MADNKADRERPMTRSPEPEDPTGLVNRHPLMRRLPRSRWIRLVLGVLFLIGGLLGFLPIVGFWMIPIGLALLGSDLPAVRRFNRRLMVRWGRWRARHSGKGLSAEEGGTRKSARVGLNGAGKSCGEDQG